MNQVFDWTRFGKVLRKDLRNIWRNAGSTLLIIALLPTAVWLFCWVIGGTDVVGAIPPMVRWVFVLCVGFLAAIMVPSRMYRHCNVPKSGIYFAMLPASKLEKYLSMVIVAVVVCPLLCMAGSMVLDTLERLLPVGVYQRYLWENHPFDLSAIANPADAAILQTLLNPCTVAFLIVLSLLGYSATFFFTTTIFKKHKVLYSILWIWLIEFVLQIVLTPVSFLLIGSDGFADWLDYYVSQDPMAMVNRIILITELFSVIYIVGLFVWSYFRLKKMKY